MAVLATRLPARFAQAASQLQRVASIATAVILVAGCGPSSADPALEVTRFESTECPAGASADCYELFVRVAGSESSDETGSCKVVAVSKDGADMSTGAVLEDLELESGKEYEEVVELPKIDDPNFDRWEPACEPTGEG